VTSGHITKGLLMGITTRMFSTAVVTALTWLTGYAVVYYRRRKAQELRAADKIAVQEWETDGGNNLAKAGPVPSSASSATRSSAA
jgi:hypothetical protein